MITVGSFKLTGDFYHQNSDRFSNLQFHHWKKWYQCNFCFWFCVNSFRVDNFIAVFWPDYSVACISLSAFLGDVVGFENRFRIWTIVQLKVFENLEKKIWLEISKIGLSGVTVNISWHGNCITAAFEPKKPSWSELGHEHSISCNRNAN